MNKPIPKEVGERIWNLYSWHIKRQTTEESPANAKWTDVSLADPQKAMDFAITYYSYFEDAVDSGAVAQGTMESIQSLQTQSESVS